MNQRLRSCLLIAPRLSLGLLCFVLALLLARTQPLTRAWEDFLVAIRYFGRGAISYREPIIIRIDEASINSLGAWPWPRSIYAQALEKLDQEEPMVIGMDLLFHTPDPGNDAILAKALEEIETPVVLGVELELELVESFGSRRWLERGEKPSLFSAVEKGYLNLIQDQDGLIRKWPLHEGAIRPSFSERVYLVATGEQPPTTGQAVVSFAGDLDAFPSISFLQLLEGDYATDLFRGKIVLIGVTAKNIDRHGVSLAALGEVPGVYLHAYLLRNFLEESWLRHVPGWLSFLLLLGLSCCWAIFLPSNSGLCMFLATVGAGTVVLISGVIAGFVGYVVPVAAFLGVLFIEPTFLLGYSYHKEVEERRRIKSLFSRHVSPEVLKEILQKRNEIDFTGERRFVAVFFADIRGFTDFTGGKEPEQVIAGINAVLGRMAQIIQNHGGLVDKFLGDGVMAVFGIPVWEDRMWEDVFSACKEMAVSDQELGREFSIGIGLSWGNVISGCVGNQERAEYTIIGSPVNLAARLEKLAGPGEIVFPFTTKWGDRLPACSYALEQVQIKGVRKPMVIGRIKAMEESK